MHCPKEPNKHCELLDSHEEQEHGLEPEKIPSLGQVNQLAITVLAAGFVGIGSLLYSINNQVIVLTGSVSSLTKEVERLQRTNDVNAERIRSIEMDILNGKAKK